MSYARTRSRAQVPASKRRLLNRRMARGKFGMIEIPIVGPWDFTRRGVDQFRDLPIPTRYGRGVDHAKRPR